MTARDWLTVLGIFAVTLTALLALIWVEEHDGHIHRPGCTKCRHERGMG